MSFRARGTVAALFMFALVSAGRAQAPASAPIQTPTEPKRQLADQDFYALREPAAAGDAQRSSA